MKRHIFLLGLCLASYLSLGYTHGSTRSNTIERYTIDPAHSSIIFKIRHFLSHVTGTFEHFEGEIHYDETRMSNCYVQATIQASSVDTNEKDRDEHLKSKDFFNTRDFPLITFRSTEWKRIQSSRNEFEIHGELTMLGFTHPVTLYAKLLGAGRNNRGVFISGWEISSMIERKKWGILYGAATLGSQVDVEIHVEAMRQGR